MTSTSNSIRVYSSLSTHTHFPYLYLSSIFYFSNIRIIAFLSQTIRGGKKKIFHENRLTKFLIDTFIMIEEIVRSDAERERHWEI